MSDPVSPTTEANAENIGENVTQPNTNPGNADPQTVANPPSGSPGTGGLPDPARDKVVPVTPALPGDVATRFTNRLINHFADRNELSKVGVREFLQIAEDTGLMHRVPYDPEKHNYLRDYADSRSIAAGGEIVAYSEAGEAIIVAGTVDGPPAPEAGDAAAVGGQHQNNRRGRPRGR